MRNIFFVALLVLAVASSAYCAGGTAKWRVGLAYSQPGGSDYRDYDKGIDSIKAEYSFGDTFEGEDTASDASAYFEYTRVRYSQHDWAAPPAWHDSRVNIVAVGANIRFGAGAKPSNDGVYAGFGVGYAYGNPSASGLVPSYGGFPEGGGYEFQWKVMAGLNWAKAMFAEASYSKISRDGIFTLGAGIRF